MWVEYYLGEIIKHIVCRNICSKKIENRLTNKTVWSQTILNWGFLYKILIEGRLIFSRKTLKYFITLAQHHYKMTQMTNLGQSKTFRNINIFVILDYPLASAKSLFKIYFGHKKTYLQTDFQTFCVPLGQTYIKILTFN